MKRPRSFSMPPCHERIDTHSGSSLTSPGGSIVTSAVTMRPSVLGTSVRVIVALAFSGTSVRNPLATAPPTIKTVSTTATALRRGRGSGSPRKMTANRAPHTPVAMLTGIAIARASAHIPVGHG